MQQPLKPKSVPTSLINNNHNAKDIMNKIRFTGKQIKLQVSTNKNQHEKRSRNKISFTRRKSMFELQGKKSICKKFQEQKTSKQQLP